MRVAILFLNLFSVATNKRAAQNQEQLNMAAKQKLREEINFSELDDIQQEDQNKRQAPQPVKEVKKYVGAA